MLTIMAPAKLNLVLEVLGKRPDGYHEIRSLVQTINLYDTITFEPASKIVLECTEPTLQSSSNLVIHAAKLVKQASNYRGGARITLEKKIPWGAGLGGGSSDAAATLLALKKLWELELTTPDLLKLAAQLGSDVPFFILQGTALLEGRGEKVTPLPPALSPMWVVLLFPPLLPAADKTKQAYLRLRQQHYTNGQFTARAAEQWGRKRKLDATLLFNAFDAVAFDFFPELNVYWKGFERAGASNIHLAGSGPTLFTLAANKKSATEVYQRLRKQGIRSAVVSSTAPSGN